jgi:uncharacterized protein YndB with AHSA1/START domain
LSERRVQFHRVLRCTPAKLYRAFTEAEALAKWLPPHGFTCVVERLDARVGGVFRMAFRNFSTGHAHAFGGEYLELVPDQLVRYTDVFDDPNLPGVMQVRARFKAVEAGAELWVEQTGIPQMIPLSMCVLGWQESLAQLATLVEPDIQAET